MKSIGMFVLLGTVASGLIIITLLASCTGEPYTLHPDDTSYSNPTLLNHLNYIQNLVSESEWFQEQGNNTWSGWMNLLLAIETALAAAVTVVMASSIWGNNNNNNRRTKAIISFILAILLIIASAGVFLVKAENERFYEENRNQYIALSQKMNTIITGFSIQFESLGITNENFESHRQEFLKLATDTYNAIDELKMEYFEKYGLEINAPE